MQIPISFEDRFPDVCVAVDSRNVLPGDVFFALRGKKCDGHSFIYDALERGAQAVVLSKPEPGLPKEKYFLTPDPIALLQAIAKSKVRKKKPKIVAVTGSYGKTTTKEFIKCFLEKQFSVFATPGNYNSQIGLPLCLINDWQDETYLVLEMGMTSPGEIERLTRIAPPDIAVLISIAPVHLASCGSLEAIAKAKVEIFSQKNTSLGFFVKELCSAMPSEFMHRLHLKNVSLSDSDAEIYMSYATENEGWIKRRGHKLEKYQLGKELFPQHRANALLAYSVASALNISEENIRKAFLNLKAPPGRFEQRIVGGIHFIHDAYNSSLDTVLSALKALPKGKRKIAILGGMNELGAFEKEAHDAMLKHASESVDVIFGLGEKIKNAAFFKEGFPFLCFESKYDLFHHLKRFLQCGDIVLIKGSRSYDLGTLIEDWQS